jgi:very-short-patch-repair endonuclease
MDKSSKAREKAANISSVSAAVQLKAARVAAKRAKLENKFLFIWKAINGPSLAREYKLVPGRLYRADFADPSTSLAIEIEGGQWCGGRHNSGQGFEDDCAKYLECALLGWVVIRLTDNMLTKEVLERIANHIRTVHKTSDAIIGT